MVVKAMCSHSVRAACIAKIFSLVEGAYQWQHWLLMIACCLVVAGPYPWQQHCMAPIVGRSLLQQFLQAALRVCTYVHVVACSLSV